MSVRGSGRGREAHSSGARNSQGAGLGVGGMESPRCHRNESPERSGAPLPSTRCPFVHHKHVAFKCVVLFTTSTQTYRLVDHKHANVSPCSPQQCTRQITDASRIVYAVANTLERPNGGAFAPWARKHFQVVGRARVPVVKVQQGAFHYRHGGPSGGSHSLSPSAASSTATTLAFDCVVNNELALRNSRLLAAYASVDPRARALVFLVKHWAKAKGLSDAPNGYPSSYCHTVLALFFLQQPPDALAEAMAAPPLAPVSRSPRAPRAPQALAVLPNLQLIGRSAAGAAGGLKVEGLDTYFCEDLGLARACVQGGLKGGVQGVPDQRSVAELVASYFRFLHWLLTRGLSRLLCVFGRGGGYYEGYDSRIGDRGQGNEQGSWIGHGLTSRSSNQTVKRESIRFVSTFNRAFCSGALAFAFLACCPRSDCCGPTASPGGFPWRIRLKPLIQRCALRAIPKPTLKQPLFPHLKQNVKLS